jgi:hypothetical protein
MTCNHRLRFYTLAALFILWSAFCCGRAHAQPLPEPCEIQVKRLFNAHRLGQIEERCIAEAVPVVHVLYAPRPPKSPAVRSGLRIGSTAVASAAASAMDERTWPSWVFLPLSMRDGLDPPIYPWTIPWWYVEADDRIWADHFASFKGYEWLHGRPDIFTLFRMRKMNPCYRQEHDDLPVMIGDLMGPEFSPGVVCTVEVWYTLGTCDSGRRCRRR